MNKTKIVNIEIMGLYYDVEVQYEPYDYRNINGPQEITSIWFGDIDLSELANIDAVNDKIMELLG